tara:strand:- start:1075 stop:1773 length:699 start_codon:yes stop_codon:yes gene_type:complete
MGSTKAGDGSVEEFPQSRRPDGSLRPVVRVKKGYVPPEEQKTYDRFKDTTPKGTMGAEAVEEAPKKPRSRGGKKKKPEGGGEDASAAPDETAAEPVAEPVAEPPVVAPPAAAEAPAAAPVNVEVDKKIKALRKRLRGIEELEAKQADGAELNADQLSKIRAKGDVEAEIEKWETFGDVDVPKKVKNLKKKVKQIEDLEEKLEKGLEINEDQQSKIDAKDSVMQELKVLEDLI